MPTETTNLDALLKASLTKTAGLDALLTKAFDKTLALDSLVLKSQALPKGLYSLAYDAQTGVFTPGNTITGAESGATATIVSVVDSGDTGTLYFNEVSGTFQDDEIIYESALGSELLDEGSLENYTGTQDDGTSDTFTGWTAGNVNDGNGDKVEATATAQSGSNAVKITSTTGIENELRSGLGDVAVISNSFCLFSYYTRGDGSNAGKFGVYNRTNPAWIIDKLSTGIVGTSYTLINWVKQIPVGCTAIDVHLYADYNSVIAATYYDDISVKQITNAALCNGTSQQTTPHLDALIKGTLTKTAGLDSLILETDITATTGLDAEIECPIGTDPTYPAYLSDLRIEASFGNRISCDAKLSSMECEGQFGARTKDPLNLSAMESEGSISTPGLLSLDAKLSCMEADGRFGLRVKDDLKLSALKIDAEITGASLLSLDRALSPIEIDASISTPGVLSLDKDLSALEIVASISREQSLSCDADLSALKIDASMGDYGLSLDKDLSNLKIIASMSREGVLELDGKLSAMICESSVSARYAFSLDANLSAMRLDSTVLVGQLLSLDGTLSKLEIDASIMAETFLSLDGNLSAMIMAAVGTGGIDGSGGSMSEAGRFDDYVLRYSR